MSTIDALRRRLDRMQDGLQTILKELKALEDSPALHRVDAILPSGRVELLLVQARDSDEAMYRAAKYAVSTHVHSTKRVRYVGPADGSVQSLGARANWMEPGDPPGVPVAEVIRNYLAERPSHE